jgi:hypothetical protein
VKFFNVNITDLKSGKLKTNVTVPLFVVVLAGKHTPETILKMVLKVSEDDSRQLKLIYSVVADVLRDAAKDNQLSKYSGVIATIEDNGERVIISIK